MGIRVDERGAIIEKVNSNAIVNSNTPEITAYGLGGQEFFDSLTLPLHGS